MVAARRLEWNYGLDRALEWAGALGRPLLLFEPLRVGYRWASTRLHGFCVEGMAEHRSRLAGTGIGYLPYVEPEAGAGKGLLEALAAHAAVVVTDEFPSFFLPRMIASAGDRLPVRLEVVDSNGIVPLRASDREFTTAFSFRRYLHGVLPDLLEEAPAETPLRELRIPAFRELPAAILDRWPAAGEGLGKGSALAALPLDREVGPVDTKGGRTTGVARLDRFLETRLVRYAEERNHPDAEVTSGLSPYLHWGHISSHEIVHRLLEAEEWTPARIALRPSGKRSGWWGLSESAEAFLDQLVTWRELGYNTAWRRLDVERYGALPAWARGTLAEHRLDARKWLYGLDAFESAATHDPLWNAAQRELRTTGTIHNYLRMLWGKKILEWSATPEEALETMLHLNNRWALDGRNPNSTSGIFWVLGRYDRGWPERPIYGKVRSMSSDSTKRKVMLKKYMSRFGEQTV